MRVSVIGCGRWGTLISWYLDSIGHEVALYGRSGSAHMQRLIQTRKNDVLELPESIGSGHHKNITERQSTEMLDGGFKSSQKNIHTEYRIKDLTTSWQTLTADLDVAVDSDALTEAKKILDAVQTVIE